MTITLDRLDPENRRRVEKLRRDRPRRLAALEAHPERWPRFLSQVEAVARADGGALAGEIGADHPHVRWLSRED